MTINKKSKREVRARMERTGEPYMVAKRAIEAGIPERVHKHVGIWATPDLGSKTDFLRSSLCDARGPTVQPEDLQVGSRMTDEEVLLEYGEHLGLPKS